jgi:hypothetical protein
MCLMAKSFKCINLCERSEHRTKGSGDMLPYLSESMEPVHLSIYHAYHMASVSEPYDRKGGICPHIIIMIRASVSERIS